MKSMKFTINGLQVRQFEEILGKEERSLEKLQEENEILRRRWSVSAKASEEKTNSLREELEHMKSVVGLLNYKMDEDKASYKRFRKE